MPGVSEVVRVWVFAGAVAHEEHKGACSDRAKWSAKVTGERGDGAHFVGGVFGFGEAVCAGVTVGASD